MEITGKLINILPLITGQGKNGAWRKQEIVIETQAQYPKKVCLSLWGDKIDLLKAQPGDMITLSFDLESREYNGRWFTEARAWKVTLSDPQGAMAPPPDDFIPPPAPANESEQPFDDLPF